MNTTCTVASIDTQQQGRRHWLAELNLSLAARADKTWLIENHHLRPLRVQRPFYPEADGYLVMARGNVVVSGRTKEMDEQKVRSYLTV